MKRALVLLALAAGACRNDAAPASPPAQAAVSSASASGSGAGSGAGSAELMLAELDQRQPVPLLPMMAHHQKQNMRDHLLAVQQIVAAAAVRDFSAVEAAARRIGYSDSMGAMCNHMGSGAPGFAAAALAFHHAADEVGRAARRQDADAALSALAKTLDHCTSCHATYKQHVVDDATWTALTSR